MMGKKEKLIVIVSKQIEIKMILTSKLANSRISEYEIIERKGTGHPDCLADGIAEELSNKFCNQCLEKEDKILRYFFDKVIIYGGNSEKVFGGGKMEKPFNILIAAMMAEDDSEFIKQTTFGYLNENLHEFKSKFAKIMPEIHKTSIKYYKNKKASDSIIASGFYPLSECELITLDIEDYLNKSIKDENTFLGEDIKVMTTKVRSEIKIIISCSFISKYIKDIKDYTSKKNEILNNLKEYINSKYISKVSLEINPDDNNNAYLSFMGSCIDSFAFGQSGKGNSLNGITNLMRPRTPEGVFGKNIVRHPGKVYNILSFIVAKRLYEVFNLNECYVHMVGKVGSDISKPEYILVESNNKLNNTDVNKEIINIIDNIETIKKEAMKVNLCRNPQQINKIKWR